MYTRPWLPDSRRECVINFDATKVCVGDVEKFIRRAVDWHGMTDLVLLIKVGETQIYTGSDSLAWKCPEHGILENCALLPLCHKNGEKILHFKFMVPNVRTKVLSIKFYPDKNAPPAQLTTVSDGFDMPNKHNSVYVKRATLSIESSGNVQDPQSLAALVLKAVVIDNREAKSDSIMKFRYNVDKNCVEAFDGVPIINHDEIAAWARQAAGNAGNAG